MLSQENYTDFLPIFPWMIFALPEIFTKRASCACTLRNQIMLPRLHISLEAVPTHNLMRMRATHKPRIDKRIKTFNCELRTGEAHHWRATRLVLRPGNTQKGERREYGDPHDCNETVNREDEKS
jgi:hypothetical protein